MTKLKAIDCNGIELKEDDEVCREGKGWTAKVASIETDGDEAWITVVFLGEHKISVCVDNQTRVWNFFRDTAFDWADRLVPETSAPTEPAPAPEFSGTDRHVDPEQLTGVRATDEAVRDVLQEHVDRTKHAATRQVCTGCRTPILTDRLRDGLCAYCWARSGGEVVTRNRILKRDPRSTGGARLVVEDEERIEVFYTPGWDEP